MVYRICSPNRSTVCDDATLTVTVEAAVPTAPPTDAKPDSRPLLDPERESSLLLVGLATLVLVLTVGLLLAFRPAPRVAFPGERMRPPSHVVGGNDGVFGGLSRPPG